MGWFPLPDDDAIHDNVAGEINAVAEKATPISTDLLLIEDSAASNAKKKVQVGNLPGGGGSAAAVDVGYGSTTLNDASRTLTTWDSAPVTGIGGFDLGTDATIWTAPAAKVYEISFDWYFTEAASTLVRVFADVWLNGTPGGGGGTKVWATGGWDGASSSDSGVSLHTVITLSADDVLRFYNYYDSANATRTAAQRVTIRQLT